DGATRERRHGVEAGVPGELLPGCDQDVAPELVGHARRRERLGHAPRAGALAAVRLAAEDRTAPAVVDGRGGHPPHADAPARDEGDVVPAAREKRPEVAADRAGAVDEDVHPAMIAGTPRGASREWVARPALSASSARARA